MMTMEEFVKELSELLGRVADSDIPASAVVDELELQLQAARDAAEAEAQ